MTEAQMLLYQHIANAVRSAHGLTDDGHGWTQWTDPAGMPRATNPYFTRERLDLVTDELRQGDASRIEQAERVEHAENMAYFAKCRGDIPEMIFYTEQAEAERNEQIEGALK